MAISRARTLSIAAWSSGMRSLPSHRIWPASKRPGGMSISFSTERAVTVLPQPDSPTTPHRLAALDAQVDAVDGAHHAVVGLEPGLQSADVEKRFGHGCLR